MAGRSIRTPGSTSAPRTIRCGGRNRCRSRPSSAHPAEIPKLPGDTGEGDADRERDQVVAGERLDVARPEDDVPLHPREERHDEEAAEQVEAQRAEDV